MALALNKSSLKQERDQLNMFRRFLPSLDLKRQQMLAALKQAREELDTVAQEVETLFNELRNLYPLLGSSTVAEQNLASLVSLKNVHIEEENVLGTKLPVAREVAFEVNEYSTLVTPFWVDLLIERLEQLAEMSVHLQVGQERVKRLDYAARKITQRVNLFEKVLIPRAAENIRKIVIFLSDQERAAVVRSKIAKKKNASAVREITGKQIVAIVQLDKVTLYGAAHQREQVLSDLQTLGCVHLLNLQANEPPTAEHPIRSEVHNALKYLAESPVHRSPAARQKDFDCVEVTRQALAIRDRRQELNDERDFLLRSIETLRPWGDFQLPSDEEFGPLRFWCYTLRHYQAEDLRKSELNWRIVAEDNQYVYVVVLSADEPQGLPTAPLDLDRRPLSELTARLEAVEEELDELHWERVALTRWSHLLAEELEEADDEVVRMDARNRTFVEGEIFAIRGWAPRTATKRLQSFAKQRELAMTVHAPTRDETPPTLLKNPESIAGAQGAVTFYITPNYHTWDPTWIIYFSFAFFFAMIVSDAGYGLLLGGLLAFFLWRKLGNSQSSIRFRNLLTAIIVSTVLYGVLIGSYFGLSPREGGLLESVQIRIGGQPLMTASNQNTMMVIAIAIGVFHLALANLVSAWQRWPSPQCLGSIGWATGLLSGLVLGVVTMMDPNPLARGLTRMGGLPYSQSQEILLLGAEWTLIGSAVAIFAFSSSRPLFSSRISDWSWRALEGLQALTGISKAFGDVLSYLRLFALGLASAQLAITFNSLAQGAAEIRGVGILLAVLILVAGHSINLLLGIVSGVVHGLRLNCIEFFSWSLRDEGYPFRAFSKKAGC